MGTEQPKPRPRFAHLSDEDLIELVSNAIDLGVERALARLKPTAQRMSLAETAAMLGVCERTVREWVKKDGLPASRAGRDYRFEADKVNAWMDARPAKPRAKLKRVK